MFRIAAIVILSAATTLTAVGWGLSFRRSAGLDPAFDRHKCGHGWCIHQTNIDSDSSRQSQFKVMALRGRFDGYFRIGPSLASWLPDSFGFGGVFSDVRFRYSGYGGPGRATPQGLLVVRFPFSIPFLLFGIYPGLTLLKRVVIPYRRRRAGKCVACGYSLIGNESGTCPECGVKA
jgi:hypothetical protein